MAESMALPVPRTGQNRWLTGLAALFGFAAGIVPGFGYLAFVLSWTDTQDGGIHRVHDIEWGIFAGVFLATAFLAQVRHAERRIAGLQMLGGVTVAYAVAAGLSRRPSELIVSLMIFTVGAIVFAIHPARGEFSARGAGVSWPMAVLAVGGSVPFVWFAVASAKLQYTLQPLNPHVRNAHYVQMAAIGLAIPLVALLASVRTRGWRIPAGAAGVAAIFYGIASVVYPLHASSAGRGWGIVAIVGGLAFLAVARVEAIWERNGS